MQVLVASGLRWIRALWARMQTGRLRRALLVAALLSIATALNLFRYPAIGMEDVLVRLLRAAADEQTQVVLVELQDTNAGTVGRALQRIAALGPAAVVLVDLPADTEQFANTLQNVPLIHAYSPSAVDHSGSAVVSAVHPPEYGIYRHQVVRFLAGTQSVPALETAVMQRLQPQTRMPVRPYLVDFSPRAASFGRISAGQVARGQLVKDMLDGRVVLVGGPATLEPRWPVPLQPDQPGMSTLEFHAYALQTLLSGRIPQRLGDAGAAVLVLVVGLIAMLVSIALAEVIGMWLLLPFFVAATLAWWGAFQFAGVFLPVVPLLLCLFAQAVIFRSEALQRRRGILQKLLLQIEVRAHDRIAPTAQSDENEQWNQIVTMVSQVLNLERSIFLFVRPGENFVREVASLGCTLDDIAEMRRDFRRAPYTDALEAGRLIQLDRRLFLRQIEDARLADDQMLMPLIFEGELQGFWCLTVRASLHVDLDALRREVSPFASQIAARMYQVSYRAQSASDADSAQGGVFAGGRTSAPEDRLPRIVGLLDARIQLFDSVFQGLSTATIVYDIFGRVLQVSSRMSELFADQEYRPYERTALDVLVDIAGVDIAEARDHLRYVIVDNGRISLPSNITIGGKHFHLLLSPVSAPGADAQQGEVDDLGARAILFELQDLSGIEGQFISREQLLLQLLSNLRNYCTSLMMTHRLLGANNLTGERRERALKMFGDTVDHLLNELREARAYLEQPESGSRHETFPLSLPTVLKEALESLEEQIASKMVEPQLDMPLVPGMALAVRDQLRQGLVAILELLIEDARDGTDLMLTVSETDRLLQLRVQNEGFGIPQESLLRYLSGTEGATSEVFAKLRDFEEVLETWGGVMLGTSEVGRGYTFVVVLAKL